MGYNINSCCLCYNPRANIKICIQANYQVLKKFRESLAVFRHHPYSYLRLCNDCSSQMKLQVFVKCFPCQMQDPTKNICQCEHCKAKFGDLPLLAEVVDQREKSSPSNIKKTENWEQHVFEKTETKPDIEEPIDYSTKDRTEETKLKVEEIVRPSTSSATSVRKIMSCEHCGKGFTHKGDMNKHLRKHTGEQPFSCPVCERKFAHTSNLARHLKVHSGDKPFFCGRCNKSFSRKDKLVLHQRTKLCMMAGQSSKS